MTTLLPEERKQQGALHQAEGTFETFDLGCSAALVSAGFALVDMDKTNPRKVKFVFERSAGTDEAVNSFWSDRLSVNARTMFDNMKMLKNRIYSDA